MMIIIKWNSQLKLSFIFNILEWAVEKKKYFNHSQKRWLWKHFLSHRVNWPNGLLNPPVYTFNLLQLKRTHASGWFNDSHRVQSELDMSSEVRRSPSEFLALQNPKKLASHKLGLIWPVRSIASVSHRTMQSANQQLNRLKVHHS